MLREKLLYSLDDVTIIPAITSDIRHRSECKVEYVPIFTAPMDSVVNEYNYKLFQEVGITPIIPRTVLLSKRFELAYKGVWIALGLEEFEQYFIKNEGIYSQIHLNILIDIANGHLRVLLDYIKKSKELAAKYNCELVLMTGNIANPEAYEELAEAGCDFIKVGIGGGNACITSSNTAIHYPMASLINQCKNRKVVNRLEAKIVADGGISSYSRAIKALALGADYVMMGSTLAKCFESAGDFISATISERDVIDGFNLNHFNTNKYTSIFSEDDKKQFIARYHPKKSFYGMSTKKAQLKIADAAGKTCKLKTSEGIEKQIEVIYTLKQYIENFLDYLRSAMSYVNVKNLEDFSRDSTLYLLSEGAKNSINK